MNIVNKLTIRHLKQNKRRTLVTIIGVIISVAMVTAVATLGFSFMELMKKQSISTNGEWHVQYRNVTKAQLKAIETDDATKALVISNDRGYAPLEGGKMRINPIGISRNIMQLVLNNFRLNCWKVDSRRQTTK